VVLEPLKAFACIFAACCISWQLTLSFLVLCSFAFLMLGKFSRLMKKATRRVLERMSDMFKILREVFDGIRVVKAFTTEAHERRRFRRVTDDYYRKSMRVITLDAVAGPVVELLGVAAVGFALCAGAYLVLNKQTRLFGTDMVSSVMGFEALLQLYILLAAIAEPVRKLSSVFSKIQTAAVASDRVFALFDRTPSVRPNALGPRIEPHSRSVEFRNVCFSYLPGAETLVEINLLVKAGETIALVGPNGCGKSTLLGLLPRFYDPDFGAVLVDGTPLRDANLRSLRKQVGLVTQDTVLFDDTIYANIAYGKPGATKEEVEEAAKRAFVHEFVVTLALGYETPVGEMGSKLSGGQKQRIALARAMIRDPRILILDEFTSQIDSESEAKIHLALREFVKGRTTFLITHRTAALDLADRIVMMDAGRVVAVGTHAELIATSAEYRRLRDTTQASPPVVFTPSNVLPRERDRKSPDSDANVSESATIKAPSPGVSSRSDGVDTPNPAVNSPPIELKAENSKSKAA
jgi:ATP-binding cassette subfamily B protein/subfamily B ATP-binding cassette protein MsbA